MAECYLNIWLEHLLSSIFKIKIALKIKILFQNWFKGYGNINRGSAKRWNLNRWRRHRKIILVLVLADKKKAVGC